jgi:hypothetical protein
MKMTMNRMGILALALAGSTTVAAAQGRPPAPRSPAPPRVVFVSADGAYQATSNDFRDSTTFRQNAEDGSLSADYKVKGGPAFNVAGGATIWRRLGVGVGVTRFSRSTPVTFSESIPHPFFFNQPRTASGDVANLQRQELGVHIQGRGVFPLSGRLQVMVFGGPSFFNVKQGVLTGATATELYPYDEVTVAAQTTSASKSKLGFNAGGDVSVFFTRQLGIGFMAQYAGTKLDVPAASGRTQEIQIGGLQAGGGLRLRF